MKRAVVLIALVAATAAHAGTRDDYVREWPLRLSRDDGGAFRVALTRDVYATAQDVVLADIEVFNAAGEAVPSALLPARAVLVRAAEPLTAELRWFPLAPKPADATADWNVRAERDATGRVSRVDVGVAAAPDAAPATRELLVDLSQLRSPLAALRFEWKASGASAQAGYRLEQSDDLTRWRATGVDVDLVDLANDNATLRRDRVALAGTYGPYLRLVPRATNTPFEITRIVAELAPPPAEAAWEWNEVAGRRVEANGVAHYEYALDARVPAERVDLAPAAGNSAAEWTVQSRENAQWTWQHRAGPWMAYAVDAGGTVERSAEQRLASLVRDRLWRADSAQPGNAPPVLRLGWRAEEIVFLAQGAGPYTLAAGSVKARRQEAPIARLVSELRAKRGGDWQPYPATLGDARALSGSAALATPPPPPKPVAWSSWLLWASLVGGAALVAAMALHLLRKPREP
ncbi:DUF3999 domain-containing protein [Tahibacter soli]|uniref:DUF3999 domain-containing protein n=1 Tax=Tahibacter soli TaxID=2983605 RepID=A0A9X3YLD2_9GAMM|nr:DUF3999 domain-containing protein [Tahibacter soli]MDC8013340.1 DUF3999 domain-containing protein [Tahibacter soli]